DAAFVAWELASGPMMGVLGPMGFTFTDDNFVLACQNQLVQWAMVKQGLGIGVNAQVIGDLEPGVERILADLPAIEFPVWLVSHRELHTSRRVRFVYDLLAEALAPA
ncbi:MAG: LysR family transcriptional regulator, partial [Myxococcota bacterium]